MSATWKPHVHYVEELLAKHARLSWLVIRLHCEHFFLPMLDFG